MDGLEFVFRLKWRNRSDSGLSVVGMPDIPATTSSLETFKSNLFRDAGGVGLDKAELRVAMEVSRTNEWPIDSQLEFERALFAFRLKAAKNEVIIVNVYEGGQREAADDVKAQSSDGQEAALECKEAPQWFLTYMQEFKEKLVEGVSGSKEQSKQVKKVDVDEMGANIGELCP